MTICGQHGLSSATAAVRGCTVPRASGPHLGLFALVGPRFPAEDSTARVRLHLCFIQSAAARGPPLQRSCHLLAPATPNQARNLAGVVAKDESAPVQCLLLVGRPACIIQGPFSSQDRRILLRQSRYCLTCPLLLRISCIPASSIIPARTSFWAKPAEIGPCLSQTVPTSLLATPSPAVVNVMRDAPLTTDLSGTLTLCQGVTEVDGVVSQDCSRVAAYATCMTTFW